MPDRARHRAVRELADHLEDLYQEALDRGATDDEAREYVETQLGETADTAADVLTAARENLGSRLGNWAEGREDSLRGSNAFFAAAADRLRDLRLAVRSLTRRPVFLLVAMVSLTIGIGANTAIFSLVNAVFIRQFPYENPEQLVRVYTVVPDRTDYGTSSFPNYLDIRDFDGPFQAVGAFKTVLSRLELQDETVRIMGEAVSQTLFPMLGVDTAIGRSFLPEEDETPGAHPVAMLGHGFWQRTFAGDPEIIGSSIRLAGRSFTVVGVTPEGFHGLTGAGVSADFFVPLVMYGTVSGSSNYSHLEDRLDRRYFVLGRAAEGVTPESMRAGLEVLASRIQENNPEIDQEWMFTTVALEDVALDPEIDSAVKPFAMLFMAAGGLVLLLACTNLSSFLLARGTEREKEIALRLAIGAQRGALVRQLLTETMVLALLGGASGLVAARMLLSLLTRYQPPLPVPITLDLGLDMTVLLFTFGISCLAGLLFGLVPALRSTNPDVAPTLKEGMAATRNRRFGLQNALVAFQMALSVVLLMGGGLFVRSLAAARSADLGFSTRNAGIAWVDLSISGVPAAEQLAMRDELTRRARALPGIDNATSASHIPFLFPASGGFYSIPGADPPGRGSGHNVQREEVDPEFFATMGIPVLEGRSFTIDDRPNTRAVAIVNETAAQRFWPGETPVGRQFSPLESENTVHIVGVVKDTKVERLREPPKPLFYFPITQSQDPDLVLVARGPAAPEEITAMLRKMIRDVSPSLMIMDAKTMEDNVGVILLPGRMAAFLLGVFGLLALTLASIGLYGVVSFSVARRTREVGIRMSLGADARAVITMILRGAMAVVGIGGVVGLATAFWLAQLVRHMLYGVGPWDLATILGVPFVLSCVAAGAALIPALRASQVDPVKALKYE